MKSVHIFPDQSISFTAYKLSKTNIVIVPAKIKNLNFQFPNPFGFAWATSFTMFASIRGIIHRPRIREILT